jgi:hypothetical protein
MLTYTTIKNVPGYEQFKTNLYNMPTERLQKNIKIFDDFLSSNKKFFMSSKKDSRMDRNCIKEYRNLLTEVLENVNKKLPKNSNSTIDKPSEINYINNTNETKTTNKKVNTMKNLNSAEITANIEQLTNKVNELLERIAVLEGRKTENHNFKKLRERNPEPKTETKKVDAPTDKSEILKLQKKVREGEKTLTKKQLTQYNFFYGQEWRKINKTIDLNDKLARSMAFTKARLNCLKRAKTY